MTKQTAYLLIACLAAGCSATIPPNVEIQARAILTPECLALFGNRAYQKRSKDILTPNPIFTISRGTEKGHPVMSCVISAANAPTADYNRSNALHACEQARESYMIEHPKALMQSCEIFAIGNEIVLGTGRAEDVRADIETKGQKKQQQ